MMSRDSKGFIILSKSENLPIHLQIYHRIKESIESGLLKHGSRVPSSRALANELSVARGTVESAYSMLLGESVFVSRGQAGTFVNIPNILVTKPKYKTLAKLNSDLEIPPPNLSHSLSSSSHVFLPGCPAYDVFPRKIWARISSNVMRRFSPNEMSYQDHLGYLPLRESLASYLRLSRGVVCEPQQIVITSGYQEALDLICKVLKVRGEKVWMEDPGYLFATKLLNDTGAEVIRVPVDEEGLIVTEGIKKSEDAKLAIVTPSHHSPLGVTMSWSRRMELLDWAGRNNAWVLEDDYDGEFRYSGFPLPSLKSLDQYDRVIYAGSFSKTLFPSIKMGYLVIPQSLMVNFMEKVNLYKSGNSIHSQFIVNEFIADGHFSRHLNKMRALYAERREITSETLTNLLGEYIEISTIKNGMHFVARLTNNKPDHEIAESFNLMGYGIHALSKWSTDPKQNGLIIGFTNVPSKRIAEAATMNLRKTLLTH